MAWTVDRPHRSTLGITMNADHKDWKQEFLLRSDLHWDNPKCRLDLDKKHLDWANENNAIVLDFGDFFCAMQGKYDKRSDKGQLRLEHQDGNYLDRLVETAAERYGPYAHLMPGIARGNHETAIRRKHETDLTERLCERLTMQTGHKVHAMGYGGWVMVRVRIGGKTFPYRIKFVHGWGGGGPVTEDTIQMQRLRARTQGADLIAFGHTHNLWSHAYEVETITASGTPTQRRVWGVKCGCYKDAYGDGYSGWEVESGHPPKPVGCIRLTLRVEHHKGRKFVVPEIGYK